MKLKTTLRHHDRFKEKHGLKDVLGDSLLLRKNPMYRWMRRRALKAGYRFVPAWDSYRRAPLFELQAILKKKTIPYNDSVPTLKRLVRKHGLDNEMDDVPVNPMSYHFHEAAHAVADAAFRSVRPRNKNEKILTALLCESFANAAESMAVAFAKDEVHRFFLEQNSYIYASVARAEKRRRAMAVWGVPGLFRVLWLSYLYSNFLLDDVPREELEDVLRFALEKEKLSKADTELGASLFHDACELNVNFRLKTARLYMRVLGIRGDVVKNLDFDFSGLLLDRRRLLERFQRMAEVDLGD